VHFCVWTLLWWKQIHELLHQDKTKTSSGEMQRSALHVNGCWKKLSQLWLLEVTPPAVPNNEHPQARLWSSTRILRFTPETSQLSHCLLNSEWPVNSWKCTLNTWHHCGEGSANDKSSDGRPPDGRLLNHFFWVNHKDVWNLAQHQGWHNKILRGLQKHVHEAKAIEDNLFFH